MAQAPPTRPTGIIVVDLDPRRPEPAKMVDAKRQKQLTLNTRRPRSP